MKGVPNLWVEKNSVEKGDVVLVEERRVPSATDYE